MKSILNETGHPNYVERMRRLIRNEIEIETRETKLAKRSGKVHQQYLNAKEATIRQDQVIEKHVRIVAERKQEVEDRESFLARLQASLDATRKSNAKKRELLDQRKQHNDMILECMHRLKEVTGTYINHEALPDREKGIIVVEDICIPFDHPGGSGEYPLEKVLKVCGGNCNPDKWLSLLQPAGHDVEDSKENSRKVNRPDTSIIEIDLTSPTNTK